MLREGSHLNDQELHAFNGCSLWYSHMHYSSMPIYRYRKFEVPISLNGLIYCMISESINDLPISVIRICDIRWLFRYRLIHPCEKVMGLFFRHKLFIVYFLLFIIVFTHDLHEVVNMNYANSHWISIIGYTPVTLWKGQLDQNPMSRLSDLCNVHGCHRGLGKTNVVGV